MLLEALGALASAGGTALVEAAASDAWEKARAGFARLLGRGDKRREAVAEGRLDATRAQLAPLSDAELDRMRQIQIGEWTTRLRDFLEEHPDGAAELRDVLADLAKAGVTVPTAAGDHAVAVGGSQSIVATTGGVAAATIDGNVTTGNPPAPVADRL